MEDEHPEMECEVCGGTNFHKESGHFYCNECQTQSQQVQEHVFEQEEAEIHKKSTRKIQKDKSEKAKNKLTSWECYNYILKGLTLELVNLGANPQLIPTVKCLWMKYLHQLEVFDINTNQAPKVSVRGSKKDLDILYNRKKRKRRRSLSTSTATLSVRRQRSTKKRALVKNQYEELSQSQTLTQNSSMANDSLSNLKSGSESSGASVKISYNKYSNAELKRIMSRKHRKDHMEDVDGELTCHKLTRKTMRASFLRSASNLTLSTLYTILYIGLLITKDPIQLGDLLRFIREGHVSFACFRHFFPEDISEKNLTLPWRSEQLLGVYLFRKRCGDMIKFLGVAKYIQKPDLIGLCRRYCRELNLPDEVFFCVMKFILISKPKMKCDKVFVPNYEARAMSFIIFTLKLLFGLDEKTEANLSTFADILNDNQFNFWKWLQFIGFRAAVIKKYHFPSNYNNINSDMYLNYLKNQNIKFQNFNRLIHTEVKDYLQILEKIVTDNDNDYFKFEPSLTPFFSYTKIIMNKIKIPNSEILLQKFQNNSLKCILQPLDYLDLAENKTKIKNGGANDDIIIEDFLYEFKNSGDYNRRAKKRLVTVRMSTSCENISMAENKSLKPTNKNVFLSNWQQGNEKYFLINRDLMKIASKKPKKLNISKKYPIHYNPFERYWMNIPLNSAVTYFCKDFMDELLEKFPLSLSMVLKECARIVEQEERDVFSEFLLSEIYLVYCVKFGYKETNKASNEIRNMVAKAVAHW
ncbi:unnamed protein product [Ceutorhynchus assimilis]|uniref:Rrn7/TAF1B C-terminal cyclin domain-containing protein n=1 Tax=Ceutorhynchus assimilis TaxID=467358 RepID=A0A9N9QLX0_9CUCU|nr:unnamed protein product [Ceutorhynchus assimilis]